MDFTDPAKRYQTEGFLRVSSMIQKQSYLSRKVRCVCTYRAGECVLEIRTCKMVWSSEYTGNTVCSARVILKNKEIFICNSQSMFFKTISQFDHTVSSSWSSSLETNTKKMENIRKKEKGKSSTYAWAEEKILILQIFYHSYVLFWQLYFNKGRSIRPYKRVPQGSIVDGDVKGSDWEGFVVLSSLKCCVTLLLGLLTACKAEHTAAPYVTHQICPNVLQLLVFLLNYTDSSEV